jgi:hypothetical protein
MNILARLHSIDRRYLYLLMAAAVIAPLIVRPGTHPSVVFDEVRNTFRILDTVPAHKIVVLSTTWGPGTMAENGPQTEVLMRHMFRKGVKFAVICWDPQGSTWTYKIGSRLEKELGKKYGVDWVHIGYRPGPIFIVISGMAEDFQKVIDHDRNGTKLSELPMTADVKTSTDVGASIEITPSSTVGTWIAFFNQPKRVPLIYCPTAVMAAEAYPFLDSGQIKGMLNGVIGAAQYETLLGLQNERTDAAAFSWSLSIAHIVIIALIILGNIGYAAGARSRARTRRT